MMGGGSAAPETITIVQDAQGRALTKSFRWVRGKLVKCQYCQTMFRVPEMRRPAAAVAGPAKDETRK